jgi:MFS family permease
MDNAILESYPLRLQPRLRFRPKRSFPCCLSIPVCVSILYLLPSTFLDSILTYLPTAGLGGSTFSSMAGSIVSDVFPPRERAAAMSFYIMGPLLGPVLGPLTGGFVAEHLGYKWVFIITSIISGLAGIYAICLPLKESYHGVLRERLIRLSQESADGLERTRIGTAKTATEGDVEKKHQQVHDGAEEGSTVYRVRYEHPPDYQRITSTKEVLKINMTRPFALFFRSIILFVLALFMSM